MGWFARAASTKQPALDYDRVIRCYGAVLEGTGKETVVSERVLPVDKDNLRRILLAAIENSPNGDRMAMEVAFVSLAKFQTISEKEQDVVDQMDQLMTTVQSKPDKIKSGRMIDQVHSEGAIYARLLDKVSKEMGLLKLQLASTK
jgi:hypothetical protein